MCIRDSDNTDSDLFTGKQISALTLNSGTNGSPPEFSLGGRNGNTSFTSSTIDAEIYFDDFRFSDIVRYTETFTPPSGPLPTTGTASNNPPGTPTTGGLTYPTSNGTSGQVLTSNGSGTVTWTTVSGAESDTLASVTSRGATTTNTVQVGRLDIGGSSSFIAPSGTNDVTFNNTFGGGAIVLRAAGDVEIQSYQGSSLLKTNTGAVTTGGIKLYYATGLTTEVERLATTSTGVTATGALHANGMLTTGPTAGDAATGVYVSMVSSHNQASAYRDMKLQSTSGGGTQTMMTLDANINTVTVQNCVVNNKLTTDDIELFGQDGVAGASQLQLKIYHDSSGGNDTIIEKSGNGNLSLKVNQLFVKSRDASEFLLTATEDNSVGLYYDGVKKLETTSAGVTITGDATITGTITTSATAVEEAVVGTITFTANGASNYTFTGTGYPTSVTQTAELKIHAGLKYKIINTAGSSHPLEFRSGGVVHPGYAAGWITGSKTGTQYITVPFYEVSGFNTSATFEYVCTLHPTNMNGTVRVAFF